MPKNPQSNITILQPAAGGFGKSLRATVPKFLIDRYGLKKGDTLLWDIRTVEIEGVTKEVIVVEVDKKIFHKK